MAASDPVTDVPTPTGTLQGVAAFSWDGTNWQPTGSAGPDVATPTGVLRGVAAFNGGPAWQPSGRAQPSVATPTGVLDGVAVYTWSGSAWAPAGGTATPSTPSGALRGVAAFNWDGTAWQPAGRAGPSVATPYGVLDGVAMFGWTGTAWAAVGAPSLSLDFMTPGTLPSGVVFTRASAATYFDATVTMQTAATNAPRWDYTGGALRGLLIEEARTNLILRSADYSNAAWQALNTTVTANQVVAPDGTMTAARLALAAVSASGQFASVNQNATVSGAYAFSVWLRGNVGGEQVYLSLTPNGVAYQETPRLTLTTAWQRYVLTGSVGAGSYSFVTGVDFRDTAQGTTPAQTIYAWGAQVEQGAFATSYIPTGAATVTRAADVATMPTGAWFSAAAYSVVAEAMGLGIPSATSLSAMFSLSDGTGNNLFMQYIYVTPFTASLLISGGTISINNNDATPVTLGVPFKFGGTLQAGTLRSSLNGAAPYVYTTAVVMPVGVNTLSFGNLNGTSDFLNGYIRRLRYWPRALSATELQSATT